MIDIDPGRQICEAPLAESVGAPAPWYVSIEKLAARLELTVTDRRHGRGLREVRPGATGTA